jgi:hypothetical protein
LYCCAGWEYIVAFIAFSITCIIHCVWAQLTWLFDLSHYLVHCLLCTSCMSEWLLLLIYLLPKMFKGALFVNSLMPCSLLLIWHLVLIMLLILNNFRNFETVLGVNVKKKAKFQWIRIKFLLKYNVPCRAYAYCDNVGFRNT